MLVVETIYLTVNCDVAIIKINIHQVSRLGS